MCNNFPWTREAFNERVAKAVRSYWLGRNRQAGMQMKKGSADTGTRGQVTGGQHMNGLAELLIDVIRAAGVPKDCILFKSPLVLPGYYRAQKKWDIVVCREGRLIAAIELKSQSGSFGNNLNNRAEEVIGLARDFWTSYRERAFGLSPQPWLGYFFLLEDAEQSRRPVGLSKSVFPPDSAFEGTSYMDRYRLLCERLVLERDYTATALVTAPKKAGAEVFREPSPELSAHAFCLSLFNRLRGGE